MWQLGLRCGGVGSLGVKRQQIFGKVGFCRKCYDRCFNGSRWRCGWFRHGVGRFNKDNGCISAYLI